MGRRKMPKIEKISDDQMNILLNFAERCKSLCFGRMPSGAEAESIASREWKELARDMNYAYPENEQNLWKSGLEWKAYWTELKNKTKAKAAHARRRSRFNRVPVKPNLNEYEQRILDLAEIAYKGRVLKKHTSDDSIGTESISPEPPNFQSTPNTVSSAVSQINDTDTTQEIQSPSVLLEKAPNKTQRNVKSLNPQVVITPISERHVTKASRLAEAIRALAASQRELARAQADMARGSHAIADALLGLTERAK